MKRWLLVVGLVAVLLFAGAVAVVADPTNVGGGFTILTSSSRGIGGFPGQGVPRGGPFAPVFEASLLSPTNVGGG